MLPAGRLRWLTCLLAVWTCAVVLRLAHVQIFRHAAWEAEAARQREQSREVEEPRGSIISRDGRLLAGALERVSVCVNPRKIAREQRVALALGLAPLAGQPRDEIERQLVAHEGFFYLAKDLDPSVAEAVSRLRQRGVDTERSERRLYPHGTLAGATVGFVSSEGRGQAGIEAFYDRTLRGVPSVYRVLRDGKSLPTQLDYRLETPGRPGQSVVLALDCRLQQLVEEELAATLREVGGKGASAVLMDVGSGELLALASLPSFDPAHVGDVAPEIRRNRAVEDALEPGSTFKPIIVAAALSVGVLAEGELVDCSGGGIEVADAFIRDHARYGLLPVWDVLAKSSNVGAVRIAQRLSATQLDDAIRRLGFGQLTGVELPAEGRGIYRGPAHWSGLSRASLAIGQEISVTPLQLAQAYAAIANGGLLVQPTLVLETRDRDGQLLTPYRPHVPTRVLSHEVATALTRMLEPVVEQGTGRAAAVPGYRIAGKTGTAQKPFAGSYQAGRHAAWFAGFFPLPEPRLVLVVCVDEPQRDFWAADVAAPAFGRIARRLTLLLGLPPDPGALA